MEILAFAKPVMFNQKKDYGSNERNEKLQNGSGRQQPD